MPSSVAAMVLTPRDDGPPVLRVEGLGRLDPAAVLGGQRRRLAALGPAGLLRRGGVGGPEPLRRLGRGRRRGPPDDADGFWALSVGSGRAGKPTRFMATFDPVATPPMLVAAQGAPAPADRLARLDAVIDGLEASLAGLGEEGWSTVVEATARAHRAAGARPARPVGRVGPRVRHPPAPGARRRRGPRRGRRVPACLRVPARACACLLYVAALGPGFAAMGGSERTGRLEVVADDLDRAVVVDVGPSVVARLADPAAAADDADLVLRGRAVPLIEGLSLRAPLPDTAAIAESDRWLLGTLAVVFDQA